MKKTLVLGGPGCGKTTRLLQVMEQALDSGVRANQIAFCSFTNAAADEARDRAMERFGLKEEDLPYFRTLHSLAFRELGVSKRDVVSKQHLLELGELTGELIDPRGYDVTVPATGMSADPLITIDGKARMMLTTLRRAWETNQDVGGDLEWFRLKRFSDAYTKFREDRGLIDFTDMLERYAFGDGGPTPVKVAIVDEAQDLTLLQWKVVEKAFSHADELWVGGDDDQAIYEWSGAATGHLMSLGYEREVLPLSHRLPQQVFDLSREVVSRIGRRFPKDTRSSGRAGAVEWVSGAEEVDLSKGKWLVLARTRYQLGPLEEEARRQGVVYSTKGRPSVAPAHVVAILAYERLRRGSRVEGPEAIAALKAMGLPVREMAEDRTYDAAELGVRFEAIWHDALVRISPDDREYYLACLRRGDKLTEAPRVRVETVHGAKGAEAENVLLVTDMTYRVKRGYEEDPDAEHRVFYVGVTRASGSLHLVAPRSVYPYPL